MGGGGEGERRGKGGGGEEGRGGEVGERRGRGGGRGKANCETEGEGDICGGRGRSGVQRWHTLTALSSIPVVLKLTLGGIFSV